MLLQFQYVVALLTSMLPFVLRADIIRGLLHVIFDDEDNQREVQESAYCMFLDLLYDCEGA